MTVKPIPEGYEGVTPYLIIKGADKAIEFYKEALGASESLRMNHPDGRVGHAEIKIGKAVVMLADEHPEMGARSPQTVGGSPVGLHLYVPDVDKTARDMVAAGANEDRAPADMFYGDRSASFTDPFGHIWHISTHVEDVAPDELEHRVAAVMKESA